MNYTNACQRLLSNTRQASLEHEKEVSRWNGIVKAICNGGELYIPGYIPYIGEDYFKPQTIGRRILVYALSQNLRPTNPQAIEWAKDWHYANGHLALDRQNQAFEREGLARMHPFDTGHLPVLSAFVRSIVIKRNVNTYASIYNEIAATNLSKYSFRTKSGKTTDWPEALHSCFQWFSRKEIEVLKPDYILCAGENVYNVISDNWKDRAIKVRFPSLQVINRYYRKDLADDHIDVEQMCATLSAIDLQKKTVYRDPGRDLCYIISRDSYYFAEMYNSIRNQITGK